MSVNTKERAKQAKGQEVLTKLLDAKMIIVVDPGQHWEGVLQSAQGCRSQIRNPLLPSNDTQGHSSNSSDASVNELREDSDQASWSLSLLGTKSLHTTAEEVSSMLNAPTPIDLLMKEFSAQYQLTSKESEIISELCGGCSGFPEIASRLQISPKTLRNHMSRIYLKTQSSSIMGLYSLTIHFLLTHKKDFHVVNKG